MKPVYPCLWFDGNAKEAATFYGSIFKDFKLLADNPMVVLFELNGSKMMGLNGGPHFKFNEAVSFVVECDTQEEIDHYWEKLTEGGQESMCGWLKDKFGISWQIVPSILGDLITDPQKAPKIIQLLQNVRKFEIAKLLEV